MQSQSSVYVLFSGGDADQDVDILPGSDGELAV